jgi:hypothetical protein
MLDPGIEAFARPPYIQRNVRSVRAMAGYFSDAHFASKSFKWNEDGAVADFMTV